MKTLWMEVSDLTGPPAGQRFFTFTGSEVFERCGICDERFAQTDEGWAAFKEHEFETHERPVHYDWAELDGRSVIIRVVQRQKEPTSLDPEGIQTELVAVVDDGTVYCLPFSYYDHGGGGFKFKPRAKAGDLLVAHDAVAELIGAGG